MNMTDNCYLSEIYSAIQGEGPLVGIRQIFIRFSGCDLRCIWCDTPDSLIKTEHCSIEEKQRKFKKIKNPINSKELVSYIKNLSPELHHSISLTGGEPLLQTNFLKNFLPKLKNEINLPLYLETGGHRHKEIKEIIDLLDYVSMDIKLSSSAKTGDLTEEHKKFLDVISKAKSLKKLWIKIVVTKDTLQEEIIDSVNMIKSVNGSLEVCLQPVTEINNISPPSETDLLNMQSNLLKSYPNIRVIPQVHKLMGQR